MKARCEVQYYRQAKQAPTFQLFDKPVPPQAFLICILVDISGKKKHADGDGSDLSQTRPGSLGVMQPAFLGIYITAHTCRP